MKQYDIGIDLGTTSIIIATEEQGVIFRQPTIGAVDTRTNSILAVGDEALKMVGQRVSNHIEHAGYKHQYCRIRKRESEDICKKQRKSVASYQYPGK